MKKTKLSIKQKQSSMKKNVIILMVTFMFATMQTKAQCTHLDLGTFYPKSNTPGAQYDSLQVIVSQCNANNYIVFNNGLPYAPGYTVTVTGTNPATNTGSTKVAVLPAVAYLFQVKTADGSCFSNYVAYNFSVLPVKLISFNATVYEKSVIVRWIVESDQDADYYKIERSTDGRDWHEVALVLAKNQTSTTAYSFTNQVPIGEYYYRLKIVNKDGKLAYSGVVAAKISDKNSGVSIVVMPNPTVATLVVRLDGKVLAATDQIRISDLSGRVVLSPITTQNGVVNVQQLPKGVYVLEVISKNNILQTTKFIKQ